VAHSSTRGGRAGRGSFSSNRLLSAEGPETRHACDWTDGLFGEPRRGFSSGNPGRAGKRRSETIANTGTALGRTTRENRRAAGHERKSRIHRRKAGRRGRHGISVFQGADRGHPTHRGHGAGIERLI